MWGEARYSALLSSVLAWAAALLASAFRLARW